MEGTVVTKSVRSCFMFLIVSVVSISARAEMKVVLNPLTNPVTVGTNKIEIQATDEQGKPVKDLVPKVLVSMPAMGTMPYMEVQGDVSGKGDGKFLSEVEIPMGGTWDITVTLEKGSDKSLFRYSVTTEIPGMMMSTF